MRRYFLLSLCMLVLTMGQAQRVIVVKQGDAESLLAAIERANGENNDKDSKRLYILIPNGYYNLGEKVLTQLSGHNIALIGESIDGTIIRNAPPKEQEGISKTAVLQNRGTGNYLQDLTLRNDLDYYNAGFAGRGVALHDKGDKTICNRVRMLSYQDTYYSDNNLSQRYMQESEIHGTVDFICGDGDVWFERCRIVTEMRKPDGSGRCVIAAPKTSKTPWGYIFNRCTIENIVSHFEYARGWNGTPHCIMLYTTLLNPELISPTRFDYRGMRTIQNDFKEYGTMDREGHDITPKTNVVTFELNDERNPVETILTAEEARRYDVKSVFGDWDPQRELRQIEKKAKKLKRKLR